MPGAPKEWCPDWYLYFEAAAVLHVPAWELAGFSYAFAGDAPVCWVNWAFEWATTKARVSEERMAEMYGGGA